LKETKQLQHLIALALDVTQKELKGATPPAPSSLSFCDATQKELKEYPLHSLLHAVSLDCSLDVTQKELKDYNLKSPIASLSSDATQKELKA
jgi:hypothetical protein